MKLRISIQIILPALLLGLFIITSSSCSKKTHSSTNKIAYNRSARIKTYKQPTSSRNAFNHGGTMKKKYIIKK